MREDTKQIGIRIPFSIYQELKQIGDARDLSFTDVAIEAFIQYLDNNTPGLCPRCHTQNDQNAKYCQQCSTPLTEEARISLIEASKIAENSEIYQEIRNIVRQELGLEKLGLTKEENKIT